MDFKQLCIDAREAAKELAAFSAEQKNLLLKNLADALVSGKDEIIKANIADIDSAEGKPAHFIDRLRLTPERITQMAEGLLKLCELCDPVGEVLEEHTNHCGLRISKVRVPLGVVGIIYEARPNVTADAAGLCLKSGNAVLLRGSKDAINSNKCIVEIFKNALELSGVNSACIQLVEDTGREGAQLMMKAGGFIDVLIPRGGAGLIKSVVENSIVPVIETGCGNCHIYIEESADYNMAESILINAKVSRPSVCNAAETLLIDQNIAKKYLPKLLSALRQQNVIIYGCEKTAEYFDIDRAATEEDYYTEYNDYIIAVKVVQNTAEAAQHIEKYSTHHSDAIVTSNAEKAEYFLNAVDSAAVYVNASTRFTDGFEFGFGAEMGISTQKLHARGPMGLKELTSYKYRVVGNGQVRK